MHSLILPDMSDSSKSLETTYLYIIENFKLEK